jgi:hypothetical protein
VAFVEFVFVSTSIGQLKACKIAEKKLGKYTGIPKTDKKATKTEHK